ncbi:hypothetical protein [Pseudomonas laurylsulfatiphila]|uniref:hypothetical protein n=1 Tax=Pseudomonas laurylsulfatiphila TaxID=2011015 RepID=UPI002160CFDE|nr:hypothetical protein [Pseudomonas laurylsulfatiphila]UVM07045.1 hypothetical protein LOY25_10220 [Pseudomonas laurylsulfatiphila]
MTVLILSLWALGVFLLIVVAVYRGKTAVKTPPTEMSGVDIVKLSGELGIGRHRTQEIHRDGESGQWKVVLKSSSGNVLRDDLYSNITKRPTKLSSKGTHVQFPKPGKSVR